MGGGAWEERVIRFLFFCPVDDPACGDACARTSNSAPFRKKFPQFEELIGRYAKTEVVNPVAAFAGMMVKLDEDFGRLMALLESSGSTTTRW